MAGIGFLGAGTILKVGERVEVHGLTTAASIWLTAAVGIGAGLGHLWLPVVGDRVRMADSRSPQTPRKTADPPPKRLGFAPSGRAYNLALQRS